MDFELNGAKELANRREHSVDFGTAARISLDPYVIEFNDRDAAASYASMPLVWSMAESLCHLHDERRRRSHHLGERSRTA
jgi:hypothetical protein